MREIRTARLTLEPQISAHAPEMFRVLSDPAIYQYENAAPQSLEWLRTRFERLESRWSPDGKQRWLNWVIRCSTLELVGYVQATVRKSGEALIAYELSSAYWGRGLGHESVGAMMSELVEHYQVNSLGAILKHANLRSLHLLEHLGFVAATPEQHTGYTLEIDELLMHCQIKHA
ncbi:MAG: GNAT family N-acetyltransferase [Comamonadaceae bacterium]